MKRTDDGGTPVEPVTVLSLLAGRRRATVCEAYLARVAVEGYRIAKAGGWI